MDDHDKLSAMFAVMEEQQAVVQSAIAGLAQERKAMREAIDTLQNTSQALSKTTGEAAERAVIESIGAGQKVASTVLKQAKEALDEAAGQVSGAGKWVTFKTAAALTGIGLVMVLTMFGMGRYMVNTELQEVERLRAEKAELETNIADLAKRGGRIKLSQCGPANRLCVEITPVQGDGPNQADFQGSWISNDNRHRYVIPKGY